MGNTVTGTPVQAQQQPTATRVPQKSSSNSLHNNARSNPQSSSTRDHTRQQIFQAIDAANTPTGYRNQNNGSEKLPSLLDRVFDDDFYYTDKNGKLLGPFTEQQMQLWYKEKSFHSSVVIKIREELFTLGQLIQKNGDSCPFQYPNEKAPANDSVELERIQARLQTLENENGRLAGRLRAMQAPMTKWTAKADKYCQTYSKITYGGQGGGNSANRGGNFPSNNSANRNSFQNNSGAGAGGRFGAGNRNNNSRNNNNNNRGGQANNAGFVVPKILAYGIAIVVVALVAHVFLK